MKPIVDDIVRNVFDASFIIRMLDEFYETELRKRLDLSTVDVNKIGMCYIASEFSMQLLLYHECL